MGHVFLYYRLFLVWFRKGTFSIMNAVFIL